MQLHFLSFLFNIASWLVLGLLIGKRIHKLKKERVNTTRFYFTTISAALIGGFLAELSNGSPDFGISLINLFVSAFAVVLSVFFAFPSYFSLFIQRSKQALSENVKVVRLRLQTIRGK